MGLVAFGFVRVVSIGKFVALRARLGFASANLGSIASTTGTSSLIAPDRTLLRKALLWFND